MNVRNILWRRQVIHSQKKSSRTGLFIFLGVETTYNARDNNNTYNARDTYNIEGQHNRTLPIY